MEVKEKQIFVANLGYSMILPTFYIVKKVSAKRCAVHELKSYLCDDDGYGQQGHKKPVEPYTENDRENDLQMMICENSIVNKKDRIYAYPWDGTPQWYDSCD